MSAVQTIFDEDFVECTLDEDFEARVERQAMTVQNLKARYKSVPSSELLADVGRAVQRLSEWYRFQKKYPESLELKDDAIAIWATLRRERARTLVQMQKALTMHLAGEKQAAYDRFAMLEPRLRTHEELQPYLDFLLVWRGLCRVRDGEFEAGLEDLEKALELREERGNDRQLEETRALIARVKTAADLAN